jgi:hypothetical protein
MSKCYAVCMYIPHTPTRPAPHPMLDEEPTADGSCTLYAPDGFGHTFPVALLSPTRGALLAERHPAVHERLCSAGDCTLHTATLRDNASCSFAKTHKIFRQGEENGVDLVLWRQQAQPGTSYFLVEGTVRKTVTLASSMTALARDLRTPSCRATPTCCWR